MKIFFYILILYFSFNACAQQTQESVLLDRNHPNLTMTSEGVTMIKEQLSEAPFFIQTLEAIMYEVDKEIELGVQVPLPKDMAGGYTHERHKRNFFILQKAGNLYQITGEEKYAEYIRDNFMAYAKMYPNLPLHPTDRSYATGKIFWQCLNDANWLVYCSQAYDCIYNYLSADERSYLENNLFRPMADFLSIENPKFFNRIHNHSTWGNAAVGMIGLVMNDDDLIDRALYGIRNDGLDETMVDNDGGFIKIAGEKRAGFLAQLDLSFSPDGHFTEGPYYLRYAMTPFLLFAKSLNSVRPELNIYSYREGILKKAVYALLNETDASGRFFPINDAQKGMSWKAREVVSAVNIAYSDFNPDPMLLSIAETQGRVLIDQSGFEVARSLKDGLAKPFIHQSISFVDGPEGNKGGLGILRMDNSEGEEICLVMKYAAHGMGHGHFDKLSYSLYDEIQEVVQDYGAARWVNIDQKGGGRYLKENNSFSKQSIGHNTVVIDSKTHYGADVKKADELSPQLYFFDTSMDSIHVVSAKEVNAYANGDLHRTMLLINSNEFSNPIVVDIFNASSAGANSYDLPTWFSGHFLNSNFNCTYEGPTISALGSKNGYEHLWLESSCSNSSETAQFTWFGGDRFYSQTFASAPSDEILIARLGANDPDYNLRRDPVLIHRKKNQDHVVFASVIESHGKYSPVTEIPIHPYPKVIQTQVLIESEDYTGIEFKTEMSTWQIVISNKDENRMSQHQVMLKDKEINWTGPYNIEKIKN